MFHTNLYFIIFFFQKTPLYIQIIFFFSVFSIIYACNDIIFGLFLCFFFSIATIVHYRQFINPTLISKFNVEVDKLENPDLPILELCKDIANENKNYALDFVNYFVEKTSLVFISINYILYYNK